MCAVRWSSSFCRCARRSAACGANGKRGERCLAVSAPQRRAPTEAVRERESLKPVLHARPHPYPLITMQEQGAHISELGGGHPDRGKAFLGEELEQ